jgi:hypothetical protein
VFGYCSFVNKTRPDETIASQMTNNYVYLKGSSAGVFRTPECNRFLFNKRKPRRCTKLPVNSEFFDKISVQWSECAAVANDILEIEVYIKLVVVLCSSIGQVLWLSAT